MGDTCESILMLGGDFHVNKKCVGSFYPRDAKAVFRTSAGAFPLRF